MSEVKITIKSESYGLQIPRTTVYVDGKFVYLSAHHKQIEFENLTKLIDSLNIDNTIVETK